MIAYSQKIYSDKTKLEAYIEAEVKEMADEVDAEKFPIEIGTDFDIVFYIMPIEDVDYIRDKIIDLKKEAI